MGKYTLFGASALVCVAVGGTAHAQGSNHRGHAAPPAHGHTAPPARGQTPYHAHPPAPTGWHQPGGGTHVSHYPPAPVTTHHTPVPSSRQPVLTSSRMPGTTGNPVPSSRRPAGLNGGLRQDAFGLSSGDNQKLTQLPQLRS